MPALLWLSVRLALATTRAKSPTVKETKAATMAVVVEVAAAAAAGRKTNGDMPCLVSRRRPQTASRFFSGHACRKAGTGVRDRDREGRQARKMNTSMKILAPTTKAPKFVNKDSNTTCQRTPKRVVLLTCFPCGQ